MRCKPGTRVKFYDYDLEVVQIGVYLKHFAPCVMSIYVPLDDKVYYVNENDTTPIK